MVRVECKGDTHAESRVQQEQDVSMSVSSTDNKLLPIVTTSATTTHTSRPSVSPSSIPVKALTVLTVDTAPSSSSRHPTRPSSVRQSVPRSTLTPLDDDVLQVYCRYKLTSHLSGALLDFAEWDDPLRDSYTWSDRIVQLLR